MKSQTRPVAIVALLFLCACIDSQRDPLDASGPGQVVQNLLFALLLSSGTATCESASVNGGGKCIFVTTTLHNGNFDLGAGNWIDAADDFCQAQRPSDLAGTYKAHMVSGGSSNRRASGAPPLLNWVLLKNTAYYRYSDKKKIGTTDAFFRFDVSGTPLENSFSTAAGSYWSGMTGAAYSACATNCTSGVHWILSSGSSGCAGSLTAKDASALAFSTPSCDTMLPLVCAQQ